MTPQDGRKFNRKSKIGFLDGDIWKDGMRGVQELLAQCASGLPTDHRRNPAEAVELWAQLKKPAINCSEAS